MKMRFFAAFLCLMGTGMLSTTLSGQQRIYQVLTKAEQMNDVDVSVIQAKNESTGELMRVVKNVSIPNNPGLVSEFLAAFDGERENASQVYETINDVSSYRKYYFRSSDREITYTLRQERDLTASVIYTDQKNMFPAFNVSIPLIGAMMPDLNSLDTAALREGLGELTLNTGTLMEGFVPMFGKLMEEYIKAMGPLLEEYMEAMKPLMEENMEAVEPQMEELQKLLEALGEEFERKAEEQPRGRGNN